MRRVKFWVEVIVSLPLLVSLAVWLLAPAYVKLTGVEVKGEVISKHEEIEMTGEDRWRHAFRIRYRYRPVDMPHWLIGEDHVTAAIYRRLQIGSPVAVRYNGVSMLRPLVSAPYIAEPTPLARISFNGEVLIVSVEFGLLIAACVMGLLAYRTKNKSLGFAAGLAGGTWIAGVAAPLGCVLFPLLVVAWRVNPRKGYGWLLLATIASSTAVLHLRIPRPAPFPAGPTRETVGVVRNLATVSVIWNTDETAQHIRSPYQMLDLEFTPDGAREPIHVLDQVDLDSVPGVRKDAAVRVIYPVSNPDAARLVGGTRNFPNNILIYLLKLTYGGVAVLLLVGTPVIWLLMKAEHWCKRLLTAIPVGQDLRQMSGLPEGDPRLKAFEALRHIHERVTAIQRPGGRD